jgi:hypothetical protein
VVFAGVTGMLAMVAFPAPVGSFSQIEPKTVLAWAKLEDTSRANAPPINKFRSAEFCIA